MCLSHASDGHEPSLAANLLLAASLNPQPRDVRAAPGGMGKAGAMGSYQLTPGLRGAACTCENAAWKLLCSQLRKTREIRDWNVELLLQDCSET